jgi:hypothetical protein
LLCHLFELPAHVKTDVGVDVVGIEIRQARVVVGELAVGNQSVDKFFYCYVLLPLGLTVLFDVPVLVVVKVFVLLVEARLVDHSVFS